MASDGKQQQKIQNRGLSAARGIIIGLGIAAVMWLLLIAGVTRLFFS